MAARKTMNIPEAQRHTVQRKLRLAPEIDAMLRASAEAEELTLSEYVTRLEQEKRLATRIAQAHADLDAAEERKIRTRLSLGK
jgi:hypothetical protein